MKTAPSRLTRAAGVIGIALSSTVLSCRSNEMTAPPIDVAAAVNSGSPTVTSVAPDSSAPGVTIDVTVNGSGFDRGSVVTLERGGVPVATIATNSTRFVTQKKLVANITIAATADTGNYDVSVTTTSGRKGVGIELFTVAYVVDELGMLGGTWSRAYAVNDRGEVVGQSCTQDCLASAFYWTEAGGLEDLGTLPGYTRSAALTINSRGHAFGMVECWMSDAACGGEYKHQLVRWEKAGGTWTVTPLEGCTSFFNDVRVHINNNDQCVGMSADRSQLLFQTVAGGKVVSSVPLPDLDAAGSVASAVSDAAMVAGSASGARHTVPVIWYRGSTGAWTILPLAMPAGHSFGRALDITEPDGAGRVRVSGYSAGAGTNGYNAVKWTLDRDVAGIWRVISTQALAFLKGTSDSWGRALNNSGVVVGHSGQQAVLWPTSGGIEALPTPNRASSRAMDINNQGWIVGAVWDRQSGCDRAAIWRQAP